MSSLFDLLMSGGFVMLPLVLFSLGVWAIIVERFLAFRRIRLAQEPFHLEAVNLLLRRDHEALRRLCGESSFLPEAHLLSVALDRLASKDSRLSSRWEEAVERKRLAVNQDLRRYLWVLGSVGSAAPFVGLFGTVVGILQSFQEMAATGQGGFNVVAAGISEALIATAAGIVVGVIAVLFFNAFQNRWAALVLNTRNQMQELSEILRENLKDGT